MNSEMIDVNTFFFVILSMLGIILLIVLIILGIKLIKTVGKINRVIDDVQEKSTKLNGVFDFVDGTTDMINTFSDKVVGRVVGLISSLFEKRKRDKDE